MTKWILIFKNPLLFTVNTCEMIVISLSAQLEDYYGELADVREWLKNSWYILNAESMPTPVQNTLFALTHFILTAAPCEVAILITCIYRWGNWSTKKKLNNLGKPTSTSSICVNADMYPHRVSEGLYLSLLYFSPGVPLKRNFESLYQSDLLHFRFKSLFQFNFNRIKILTGYKFL